MTGGGDEPDPGRKRDRFTIRENEIEISGRSDPSPEEQAEADRVFRRILKNRKEERDDEDPSRPTL